MFSTESWPRPAYRFWTLTQRFQKFLLVGGVGLGVNLVALFVLHDVVSLQLKVAAPLAIAISMAVTFLLNELWTWHDRGSGRVLTRLMLYVPINTVGLIINTQVLLFLEGRYGVYYLLANLIGAVVAAVWNFFLNNAVTWRA
ncbi:MAG TPA: GtrA family protein [Thermomicrobiales bacterium]|nr:GtrA family protein [Thermomicrobiales bacterium]